MPSVHEENQYGREQHVKSYGVVDLSNRGLKRIECLPRGISPFTLLLNNNDIHKVENLQYFTQLQQLSLAGNHIVDIKGIGAAVSLRVLDLSNNSIVAIEGISSLENLEWLNLSGNSIEEIKNIDSNTNLSHLDLSDNSIAVLSGLRTLKQLKTLLLHGNLISSLAVIKDQLSSTVRTLSLADNEISDLTEMVYLSSLVNLEQLSVLNNPCVMAGSSSRLEVNFRPYLVYCCVGLRNLDGHLVSNEERSLANVLDRAFGEIGHPSLGQHVQLVSILHHISLGHHQFGARQSTVTEKPIPQDVIDDANCEELLESESFYLPVPSPEASITLQSDDPIMSDEEAFRLLSLAATIIQAHVRGFLVRRKFDFCQFRRRKHAAALIQGAWRGYRARTLDIKMVNIRNELRVRRLVSLINHLHTALQSEREKAVTSREEILKAVKYLWQQIREQNKINRVKLHQEQVRAAVKLQTCWRGYMVRKSYPQISQKTSKDKVHTVFALCLSLQKQLDVVTSQIKEMQKDIRRKEVSQHDEVSARSDGQDHYPDRTVVQLDTSEENMVTSSYSELELVDTNTASSSNSQVDLKEDTAPSSYSELDITEYTMIPSSHSEQDSSGDNMASSSNSQLEDNVILSSHSELDAVKNSISSSSNSQLKYNMIPLPHSEQDSSGDKMASSSNSQLEDNVIASSYSELDVVKNNIGSSSNSQLVDIIPPLHSKQDPPGDNTSSSSHSQLDTVEDIVTSFSVTSSRVDGMDQSDGGIVSSAYQQVPIEDNATLQPSHQVNTLGNNVALSNAEDNVAPLNAEALDPQEDNMAPLNADTLDPLKDKMAPSSAETLDPNEDKKAPLSAEPLDPQEDNMAPLNAEALDHLEDNMALSNADTLDTNEDNTVTSSAKLVDPQEDNMARPSVEPVDPCKDNVSPSPISEVDPLQATMPPYESQSSEEHNAVPEKHLFSKSSRVGQDAGPGSDKASEDDLYDMIPHIIVSSPAPTDDECSDKDSVNEEDVREMQSVFSEEDQESCNTTDTRADVEPSKHRNGADILSRVKTSEQPPGDKEPTTKAIQAKQKKFISNNQQTIDPVGLKIDGSRSSSAQSGRTASVSEITKDQECREAKQSRVGSTKGSLPNLGERATNLLSQLRSEIANMKSARLSSVSLESEASAEKEGDETNEVKHDQDETIPTPEVVPSSSQSEAEGGTTPPEEGPVTYRLPLFEDVAMSFSLDDLLVDPECEGESAEPFTAVTVTKECTSNTANEDDERGDAS